MKYEVKMSGVCARGAVLEIEDGKFLDGQIIGGCDGNHKGIMSLCRGMEIDEIADRLEGIRCGFRPTSCPDQLAKALRKIAEESR